ncbi:X-Pro dipeptidyl-peptidase [Ktedonobacteria bacterium brp13]|nr:X-Pro dipeptidyl-peptidase [Ktedonobacteria bacterium brp13]
MDEQKKKKNKDTLASFRPGRFLSSVVRGERARRAYLAEWLGLPPPRYKVKAKHNLRIPMADGHVLLADHYAPRSAERLPTILIRSVWGRAWYDFPSGFMYSLISSRFAEQGYHVVLQEVRSDINGDLFATDERADGLATLDWLMQQSWCSGVVGMWGLSYLGSMQWAVAKDAPPCLQALTPGVTTSWMRSLFYQDDTLTLQNFIVVLALLSMGQEPFWKMVSQARRLEQRFAAAFALVPLLETDVVASGKPNASYRKALTSPQPDSSFWRQIDYRADVSAVIIPTHLISGWHDIFLRDLLDDYTRMHDAGQRPYLTIGAWGHMDPEGGFGNIRESLIWFDAQLKGNTTRLRERPVNVYMMGSDEWHAIETWPPVARPQCYYLHTQQQLTTQHTYTTEDTMPDHYRYDPADPTPSVGGAILDGKCGPQDNRLLEARSDVLSYTSEPFTQELSIMGTAQLTLYVQASAASTDFFGRICDVDSDGLSLNVTDGLLHLPANSDECRRITIDLLPTAHCFKTGHRLRLLVASGAHPRWVRNYGTSETIATASTMVASEQSIYHDEVYCSELRLPVYEERS